MENTRQLERRRIQARIDIATELFKQEGFDVRLEDDSLVADGAPPKSGFPVVIFVLTVAKDFLDVLDVTLIMMVVTKPLSLMMGVIIFTWMSIHFSGRFWRKKGLKVLGKIWLRFFGTSVLEMIPIVGILPLNSWFVLWAYHKEKKLVKAFDAVLRKLSELE